MLFNSFEFFLFLPIVWGLYWVLRRQLRLQNLLIIVASYVFYGWWDWRFLLLIAFTSAWSYVVGLIELKRWDAKPSRLLVTISLLVNLGILGYFKYFNFFVESLEAALGGVLPADFAVNLHLNLILPVGISFYTFQALSYTIDVYRRNIGPTRDPFAFFAFISFFPQLVAGPIERATNLLPQFLGARRFDYADAVLGCRQMLWGFFKKIVIADNCAMLANGLFNVEGGQANAAALLLGIFFFTMQIYGDFSGYSDIAIGCSRLFGIRLMRNFAFPYFSRDIAEFWRKWHISLTTWFRDYLYIPLGGSRGTKAQVIRNTFVIFLVSGLWHGANWTFVVWGAFHACLFLPLLLGATNRRHLDVVAESRALPTWRELLAMVLTFTTVMIGWLPFRAQTTGEMLSWFGALVSPCAYHLVDRQTGTNETLALIVVLLIVEWINRREAFGFVRLPKWRALRWVIYLTVVMILISYRPAPQPFVYFQF